MKRIFLLFLLSALILSLFAACGGTPTPSGNDTKDGTTEGTQEPTCQVTFSGTDRSNLTVQKGTLLEQPADPEKSGQIFGGWYTDPEQTQKAVFPLQINQDTTLYAQFYTYQTAFQSARKDTIGEAVAGYEYDYTVTATATYSALTLNGKTNGNSKYSNSGNVPFYDEHVNSGVLFYDGSKYQIRRGNTLQKISLDENGLLRDYSVEEVDDSYRFDSSSFAKALFEYDESQLKSIEKTQTPNEYKLNTSFNASKGIAMAGNYLNSAAVKKLIGDLPETSVNTGMYVTFSNGEVKSYRYEMNINVSSIQFSLVYSLTFKNVGVAATITPKTFTGLSLTASEIAATKTEVASALSTFIGGAHSGYDFKVTTGVEFPSKNEINSTFKGSAMRKIDGSTVYFHNDVEIDSDYKNADLYKSAGVEDVHVKRTRLANGDVYDIEKKVLADKTTLISPYTSNDTDSYFLFRAFDQIENFTFIQKTTKDSTVTYSIGVAKADVAGILTWLNSELDLDPLGKATVSPTVFGTFNGSAITPDEISFTVVLKDGVLDSVKITSDGNFKTAFAGSRDFTATADATYNFDYSVTVNKKGDTFEPFTAVKDAK